MRLIRTAARLGPQTCCPDILPGGRITRVQYTVPRPTIERAISYDHFIGSLGLFCRRSRPVQLQIGSCRGIDDRLSRVVASAGVAAEKRRPVSKRGCLSGLIG